MYNKVTPGEKLSIEHIISTLEKDFSNIEVTSILGSDSAYDRNRKVFLLILEDKFGF